MDDGHIAVAQGVGVHGAQLGRRLEEQLGGQLAVHGQGRAALHRGLPAGGHLGGIDHVGAPRQHLPGDGVEGAAGLAGQDAGGLHHVVVDGGHLQHVGQGGPAAVLVQVALDHRDVQGLAVGGHALGQGGGGLGQAVVLAELDGLAAAHRHRVIVGELVVDQPGLSLVDEALLVEASHLGAHGGGGVQQVAGAGLRLGKQLQVKRQFVPVHHVFPFFVVCVPAPGPVRTCLTAGS